jgi:hypothetical protein
MPKAGDSRVLLRKSSPQPGTLLVVSFRGRDDRGGQTGAAVSRGVACKKKYR